nr:hypothetical protein Iba_chr12eCG14230 [Ipomoea batatas]
MIYPAVYLVAAFFDIILALSALSSDSFFGTNPSPLHSGQMPEPPQSSQIFVGACLLNTLVLEKIISVEWINVPLKLEHITGKAKYFFNMQCTSISAEALVLLTSRVAAAPTTVAATAIEAAVSGNAEEIFSFFPTCAFDFLALGEPMLLWNE